MTDKEIKIDNSIMKELFDVEDGEAIDVADEQYSIGRITVVSNPDTWEEFMNKYSLSVDELNKMFSSKVFPDERTPKMFISTIRVKEMIQAYFTRPKFEIDTEEKMWDKKCSS